MLTPIKNCSVFKQFILWTTENYAKQFQSDPAKNAEGKIDQAILQGYLETESLEFPISFYINEVLL